MKDIIITNNAYVYKKYKDSFKIVYDESRTYLDVLEYVRDQVHNGHKLTTHPLSGSVKPNETPYKTIMISKDKNSLDHNSLMIIEDSIATTKKLINNKPTPNWPEKVLDDFRVIDLSLIENVINKLI